MNYTISNWNKVKTTTISNIPIEILNEIFVYLDGISRKNASATCKIWFAIIRTNRKILNHICFGKYGPTSLDDLQVYPTN